MGLLDNNRVLTTPRTGLEGSDFKMLSSNDAFDVWKWDSTYQGVKKYFDVAFRDVFAWHTSRVVFLVKGNITDSPTLIVTNETTFPGLRKDADNSYPNIVKIIAAPCTFIYGNTSNRYGNITNLTGDDCRLCVIFSNGQIYHNYPSCNDTYDFYSPTLAKQGSTTTVDEMFFKFAESVVWDLPTRKHPVKTQTGDDATLIATGCYYYNPALPDNNYEAHPALNQANGYGNTVGFAATNTVNPASDGTTVSERPRFWFTNRDDYYANPFRYLGGYVTENYYTMIGSYQGNEGSVSPSRICLFGTQDGGRSWYALYELGAHTQRAKHGNSYYAASNFPGVPLAQVGTAGDNIYSVKRRTVIMPSTDDKEPSTLFEYDTPVNVASIVGDADSIVFTTASAHGLSNGDVVVVDFQQGVSANDRDFDWMVNSNADGTSGGNGILMKVVSVTSTTFVATLYLSNPDNNITARHIHCLNKCKDGVAIGCGEEYFDKGGWVLYLFMRNMKRTNIAGSLDILRLTSTIDSIQRPLGVIIQQEGDETYCYFASDTANILMTDTTMPSGRTDKFNHSSTGVWKMKLSEVDEFVEKAQMKLNCNQVCFGFQKFGNAFVYCGEDGLIAVSYDNCESWTECRVPGPCAYYISHFCGVTYDGKICIDDFLLQLKK